MRSDEAMGLVANGAASRSFIARLPSLLAALGPVKASSYGIARRIVNALHAGYAVPDYAALESCRAIWIAVPDATLERVLGDLSAQTPIRDARLILCESEWDSQALSHLRSQGAQVASLNAFPDSDDQVFVTEGDPEAVREVARVLAVEKRKFIELKPATKALYFSGVRFAAELILPWIAGSVESLRAAGFSRSDATKLSESLAVQAVRSFGRAGRKAWNRQAGVHMRKALNSQLQAMRTVDPQLAALYGEGIKSASTFFDGD